MQRDRRATPRLWLCRVGVSALVVSLLAHPLLPHPELGQQPGDYIRVDVKLVLLEATVWNSAGETLDNLQREDFILFEGGIQQPIAHFSRDELPLAVTLVIDTSGSMAPYMEPLRKAALAALDRLKPEDRVALFTFTSGAKLRAPLTRDKELVARQIRRFHGGGETNIREGLHRAARYLREQAPQERRVILLVSDNLSDSIASHSPEETLQELLEADAALYNIKIVNWSQVGMPREVLLKMDLVELPKLVALTGGTLVNVHNLEGLPPACVALIALLKSRYTLGFYPGHEVDGKFHKLSLSLQPSFGEKNHEYHILSKDGYYATTRVSPVPRRKLN